MRSEEYSDVVDALLRITEQVEVCDIPSREKDAKGRLLGKRVLCASVPTGMRFVMTAENVLEVAYFPGEGREERAKRELLRQAAMGVAGATGGHSARGVYDATRYHKKLAAGRFAHG